MTTRCGFGRATLIVTTIVLLFGAGCSASGGNDPAPQQPSTTPAVDGQNVSPVDLPELPKVKDAEGSVKEATFGKCVAEPGTQTMTGKVTNSTKKPADYLVTINWINARSDVRGRGFAVVKAVKPDQTKSWTVTATVADGASQCTHNVVRGSVK